jgi:hypothetical protein
MKTALLSIIAYASRIEMDERPKGQSPFEGLPENVKFISYKGNQGFSTKLSIVKTPYIGKYDLRRKIEPKTQSWWQTLLEPLGAGEGDSTIPITNNLQTQMVCSLYLGGSYQEMIVVPDTGSRWLVIEDIACETCLGNKYDSVSETSDRLKFPIDPPAEGEDPTPPVIESRNYGSVTTTG